MRDKTALSDKDESSLLRSTKVLIDPSHRDTKPLRSTSDIAAEIAGYIRQVAPPDVLYSLSGEGSSDFGKYLEKPSLFAREVLGIDFTPDQVTIADLVRHSRFVAIESGHALGKTTVAACLVIWWLSVHRTAKAITTAPTAVQVNKVLWQTMRSLKDHAKIKVPGEIFLTPRWDIATDRFAIGISPRKDTDVDVASLQGYHDAFLFAVLDEAGGLTAPLWNAVTSLVTAENNKLFAIGNPISKSGRFYEATQSPIYRTMRLSCLSHPNVVERKEIVPGAVSWIWVNERVKEWCHVVTTEGAKTFWWEDENGIKRLYEPLPVFEARVLGRPPDEADNQLIPLAWVQAAETAWIEMEDPTAGERVIGLDIARFGADESAMVFRIGHNVMWCRRQRGNDVVQTANWLMEEIRENNVERALVDVTGGLGAGCVDVCNNAGFNIESVNFSSAALQKTKFSNVRHESWWTVRELLRKGQMTLPEDSLLEGDLTAPHLEPADSQGRVRVEEKDRVKARLGRSPDSGDALAASYAGTVIENEGGITQNYASELSTASLARENGAVGSRWNVAQSHSGKSRWRI